MGRRVELQILGNFSLTIDGHPITGRWATRRASELVQLLALAPGYRLVRDQAVEALWPALSAEAGMANLRKAAFHARRTLGDDRAIVLRQQQVMLYPDADLSCDLKEFLVAADEALQRRDPVAAAAAAARYSGPLLPAARYADWAEEPRRQAADRYLEVLRLCNRSDLVLEQDPSDEEACRAVMESALASGHRHRAVAAYQRHREALVEDLGIEPEATVKTLYRRARTRPIPADATLVGRDSQLATIDALLVDEGAGPQPMVIRGPAGIGKTALARELCRRAAAAGWVSVCVAAEPVSEGYATLRLVLARLTAAHPDAVDALDSAARARLGLLAPKLGAGRPGILPTRHQMIGMTQRLLKAAAGDAGCLVVVDDLEGADRSSLETLALLCDGYPGRLVICLVHRLPTADRVGTILIRAARLQPPVVLDLGPLTEAESRELASRSNPEIDSSIVDELVARSEGVPIFVTALSTARGGVANGLAGVLQNQLVELSPEQALSLRRLALATGPLSLTDVLALSDLAEGAAEALLDKVLACGVLVVAEDGYRFRHDLVRSCLADQLAPHQRASVHRAAARRLVQLRGHPAQVAEHWSAGGCPEEAADWYTVAAREAMERGAFLAARDFVDAALAEVRGQPVALHQRAAVLDALGDPGALPAYDAAIEVADPHEVDELRALQGLAQIKLGDPEGALKTIGAAQPQTLPAQLARALTFSGASLLGAAGPEVGSRLSAQGRRLALRSGDPTAVVVACWAQAAAAHARGELRTSLFIDLEDTRTLPALAVSVFDGQLCITQRLLYGDRPYADVIGFTRRFQAQAQRMGAARAVAFATTLRGEAELLSGRLDAAEQDLRAGAQLHHRIAASTGESISYQRLAEVARAKGDRSTALRLLDESLAIARDSDVGFHLFDRIYGTRITLARDAVEAKNLLYEAEEAVRGPLETCPGCRITLAVPAAIAAARAGDLERLARWGRSATWHAEVVMHLPAWDAALEEVRGFSALAHRNVTAARAHFAAAAALFQRAEHPLEAHRCRTEAKKAQDLLPTGGPVE